MNRRSRGPLPSLQEASYPQQLHQTLIKNSYQGATPRGHLVGHITRDSTAIEVRERFPEQTEQRTARNKKRAQTKSTRSKKQKVQKQLKSLPIAKRKRGRPKKSERVLSGRRLPRDCSIGVKTSSKDYRQYWRGYKLHIDVADRQVPISCLLTAASLHDSQAAIPLATIMAQRVSLYAVMDAAYDAQDIREHCESLGQGPLIDSVQRAVPIPHHTRQDSLRGYDKRRKLPQTTVKAK